MDETTFNSSSLNEDERDEYFLLWAKQCLEIKKLDKLKAQANDLELQIDAKRNQMSTYSDKIQTVRCTEETMQVLDKLEKEKKNTDVDYFKNLKAKLSGKIVTDTGCAWDEIANMAPAENQEEISEQFKLMGELIDGLPDSQIVSNYLKEVIMELERGMEKQERYNNLLKETAVAERKVKEVLFSRHLLHQAFES